MLQVSPSQNAETDCKQIQNLKRRTVIIDTRANLAGNSRLAKSPARQRYDEFDGQYIGGSWRPGRIGTKAIDRDPYSGEFIAEIIEGDQTDLGEAYRAAAKAQVAWAMDAR